MEPYTWFYLVVALIAIIPMCIFWVSYRRVQSRKLLITTLAFSIFFVKAIVMSLEVVFAAMGGGDFPEESWISLAAVLDIVIITLFALPLLQHNGENEGETLEKGSPSSTVPPSDPEMMTEKDLAGRTEHDSDTEGTGEKVQD